MTASVTSIPGPLEPVEDLVHVPLLAGEEEDKVDLGLLDGQSQAHLAGSLCSGIRENVLSCEARV